MPINQKNYPMRHTSKGLVDAFDATDKFPGACVGLANLIFDQGNPEIVVSRPGVTEAANFERQNYLNLPGAAGDFASTPNAAPIQITGDIDIRWLVALDNWLPAAAQMIVSKSDSTGNQQSFFIFVAATGGVSTAGQIVFRWSANGSALVSLVQFTPTNRATRIAGTAYWGRIALDADNGSGGHSVFYYESADGISWTLITVIPVAGVTSIFNSTAPLELGTRNAGVSNPLKGKIYEVEILNGIDGIAATFFDANDAAAGAPTLTSSLTGEVYTMQGASSIMDASTTFPNAGFVSVHCTIGDYVYGMVATSTNVGKDQPFAFNHATGLFTPITGAVAGNCPVSPSTAGAWTPPTMAVIGTKLIVTHPGFPGGATKFGVLDISNLAAPTWTATDTAVNALPSVPIAVANYRNRAYFWCGNTLPYSDVLDPLTRTLAAQSLTIGDSTSGTALQGLPVQTQSGGIVSALIAFKGFQTWQITGDTTTADLAQNFISLTMGTQSPRSVCLSPLGVYFASASGPKVIDQFGILRSLTHSAQEIEPDIQVPWQNMQTPSRVAGAYSGDLYRLCMDTVIDGVNVTNDYWFDEHRRRWNGPHTFPYDCASQHEDHFIITGADNPGVLIHSRSTPNAASVYQDIGVAFMAILQSSTFPKTGHMTMKQVVESTVELAASGGAASYAITGLDDQGNVLNSCNVSILGAGSLWGVGVWGSFVWGATNNKPSVYTVPWTAPLVFKKMALYIAATASASVSFGTFFARYQDAGYSNNRPTPT